MAACWRRDQARRWNKHDRHNLGCNAVIIKARYPSGVAVTLPVANAETIDRGDKRRSFLCYVFPLHFEKFMKSKKPLRLPRCLFVIALFASSMTAAAESVATVDKAFAGKVSQGGRFEVEAGELAQGKAASQDVKDFAARDVADHNQVNAELQSIANTQSLPLAPKLNKKFRKMLSSLSALSGPAFDQAYVAAMSQIHIKDEDILAKEAADAASPDWKAFAAKTDGIVRGHVVALYALQAKL